MCALPLTAAAESTSGRRCHSVPGWFAADSSAALVGCHEAPQTNVLLVSIDTLRAELDQPLLQKKRCFIARGDR